MKINIIRIILIILLIWTFSIIFSFSSQNSEKSGNISGSITETVDKIIGSTKNKSEIEKQQILHHMESIIRKIAHFSIYTLVGFLLMAFISTYSFKELDCIAISLILGVIYASLDEIHQFFVPGRATMITDVILDSMGVLCGIFLLMFLFEVREKIAQRKKTIREMV